MVGGALGRCRVASAGRERLASACAQPPFCDVDEWAARTRLNRAYHLSDRLFRQRFLSGRAIFVGLRFLHLAAPFLLGGGAIRGGAILTTAVLRLNLIDTREH